MIFLLILTLTSFSQIVHAEGWSDAPSGSDQNATMNFYCAKLTKEEVVSEDVTTEEEKNFPDDYKVVTFATPTDGVGTPTDQLDIQLMDVYKVLVAILACIVCMIAWGVFRTVYRILTSQKI